MLEHAVVVFGQRPEGGGTEEPGLLIVHELHHLRVPVEEFQHLHVLDLGHSDALQGLVLDQLQVDLQDIQSVLFEEVVVEFFERHLLEEGLGLLVYCVDHSLGVRQDAQ